MLGHCCTERNYSLSIGFESVLSLERLDEAPSARLGGLLFTGPSAVKVSLTNVCGR